MNWISERSFLSKLRYSRTTVEAEVVNEDVKFGQHTAFAMLLPETAFISNFSMEVILFCNLTLFLLPEDRREVL